MMDNWEFFVSVFSVFSFQYRFRWLEVEDNIFGGLQREKRVGLGTMLGKGLVRKT